MNEYLDLLSPEMIENLFLATNKETKTQKIDINNNNNIARNKYCYEGSYSLSSEWKYKEHWYKDLDYFNTLQAGEVGYVLRNRGQEDFLIYSCTIVLKDYIHKIIVFEVIEMWHCRSSVNEQLAKLGVI
jgi:hypothetical protein